MDEKVHLAAPSNISGSEHRNETVYGSGPVGVVWTVEEAIENVGVGTYQVFIFCQSITERSILHVSASSLMVCDSFLHSLFVSCDGNYMC